MALTSCFDFEFESEYEDINGIYLEFVTDYPYGGQKLLFRGDTGYIIHYDSLLVYDFARIDSIYLSDFYFFGYEITDILIEDDYAYLLLPVGLRVVDMSNTQPQIIGTLDLQSPYIVDKSGNYLYIGTSDNFITIDVTEKTNPVLLSTYELDNGINYLEVDSNFAYILSGHEIQILNIEDPNAPTLTHSLSFPINYLRTFSKKGGYIYVSAIYPDSLSSALITYDLSVNHTLHPVSQITCPFLIRYIDSRSQYTLALSLSALYLLNLEYPSAPCIGEMIAPGGSYGIIHNNYIYTLDYWSLNIFEIKQAE
jgi:hypothetical protein